MKAELTGVNCEFSSSQKVIDVGADEDLEGILINYICSKCESEEKLSIDRTAMEAGRKDFSCSKCGFENSVTMKMDKAEDLGPANLKKIFENLVSAKDELIKQLTEDRESLIRDNKFAVDAASEMQKLLRRALPMAKALDFVLETLKAWSVRESAVTSVEIETLLATKIDSDKSIEESFSVQVKTDD